MENIVKNWNGKITVNGVEYDSAEKCDFKALKGGFRILLHPAVQSTVTEPVRASESVGSTVQEVAKTGEIKITVKPYMTRPSEPGFDFMEKWNNNKPMPLREMVGRKIKETRGMVYMELHGMAEPVITCMRCGRKLTNPISQKYGIGPECLGKVGLAFEINDVEAIKKALVEVKWEGWVIKSAILEEVEV